MRDRPPLGSCGGSLVANARASAITSAAPRAGSSVAHRLTSCASTCSDVSIPARKIATKVTALVIKNSAAWRRAASSAGTPSLVSTNAPNAGPPAPPAGTSTFAPCSASPSTSARRHGITRSKTDHSARTNPSIDSTRQIAAATSHQGSADEKRARISPMPGSERISTTAATSRTTKKPPRLAMARTSTDSSRGDA